jgi:hypothetical protein
MKEVQNCASRVLEASKEPNMEHYIFNKMHMVKTEANRKAKFNLQIKSERQRQKNGLSVRNFCKLLLSS